MWIDIITYSIATILVLWFLYDKYATSEEKEMDLDENENEDDEVISMDLVNKWNGLIVSRVIFLSFDGVLHKCERGDFSAVGEAIKLVNQIEDVGIVLNSNWRFFCSEEELIGRLKGLESNIIGVVGELSSHSSDSKYSAAKSWIEEMIPAAKWCAITGTNEGYPKTSKNVVLIDRLEGLNLDNSDTLDRVKWALGDIKAVH